MINTPYSHLNFDDEVWKVTFQLQQSDTMRKWEGCTYNLMFF